MCVIKSSKISFLITLAKRRLKNKRFEKDRAEILTLLSYSIIFIFNKLLSYRFSLEVNPLNEKRRKFNEAFETLGSLKVFCFLNGRIARIQSQLKRLILLILVHLIDLSFKKILDLDPY